MCGVAWCPHVLARLCFCDSLEAENDFEGQVFGVASCSYEGANDIAFVTPAGALLEIEVPERVTDTGKEGPKVSLRELAARGQIVIQRGKDA